RNRGRLPHGRDRLSRVQGHPRGLDRSDREADSGARRGDRREPGDGRRSARARRAASGRDRRGDAPTSARTGRASMSRRQWAAACLVAWAAAISACKSTTASEEPKVKLSPRATEEVEEGAARAVAKPLEILADRIELMLPPAMYTELTLRQETFGHREFQTKTGRRISLTPPEGGTTQHPWAMVGP